MIPIDITLDPYYLAPPSPPETILEHIEGWRSQLRPAFDIHGNRSTFSTLENLTHGLYLVESLPLARPWASTREALLYDFDSHMEWLSQFPTHDVPIGFLPLWMQFDSVAHFLINEESRICPFPHIRYP